MAKLNRRDYYSAIPQLEKTVTNITDHIKVTDEQVQVQIEDLYGDVSTVTQTAGDLTIALNSEVEGRETYIRAYNGGVLVAYKPESGTGNNYGVLTNANGSVDIVYLTWADGEPTVTTTYATYGTSIILGDSNSTTRIEIETTSGSTYVNGGSITFYGTNGVTTLGLDGTGYPYWTTQGNDIKILPRGNLILENATGLSINGSHDLSSEYAPDYAIEIYNQNDSSYPFEVDWDGTVHFYNPGNTFLKESHSFTISSIASGSTSGATSETFTMAGYYPVGIVGYKTGTGKVMFARMEITSASSGECTIYYNAYNAANSASGSLSASVDILWVKET